MDERKEDIKETVLDSKRMRAKKSSHTTSEAALNRVEDNNSNDIDYQEVLMKLITDGTILGIEIPKNWNGQSCEALPASGAETNHVFIEKISGALYPPKSKNEVHHDEHEKRNSGGVGEKFKASTKNGSESDQLEDEQADGNDETVEHVKIEEDSLEQNEEDNSLNTESTEASCDVEVKEKEKEETTPEEVDKPTRKLTRLQSRRLPQPKVTRQSKRISKRLALNRKRIGSPRKNFKKKISVLVTKKKTPVKREVANDNETASESDSYNESVEECDEISEEDEEAYRARMKQAERELIQAELIRNNNLQKLRSLELKAYANVIDALRAAGGLTEKSRSVMESMKKVFNVPEIRHKAEIRRALADDDLESIAQTIHFGNSHSESWHAEGKLDFPTLPTLVKYDKAESCVQANRVYHPFEEPRGYDVPEIFEEGVIITKYEGPSLSDIGETESSEEPIYTSEPPIVDDREADDMKELKWLIDCVKRGKKPHLVQRNDHRSKWKENVMSKAIQHRIEIAEQELVGLDAEGNETVDLLCHESYSPIRDLSPDPEMLIDNEQPATPPNVSASGPSSLFDGQFNNSRKLDEKRSSSTDSASERGGDSEPEHTENMDDVLFAHTVGNSPTLSSPPMVVSRTEEVCTTNVAPQSNPRGQPGSNGRKRAEQESRTPERRTRTRGRSRGRSRRGRLRALHEDPPSHSPSEEELIRGSCHPDIEDYGPSSPKVRRFQQKRGNRRKSELKEKKEYPEEEFVVNDKGYLPQGGVTSPIRKYFEGEDIEFKGKAKLEINENGISCLESYHSNRMESSLLEIRQVQRKNVMNQQILQHQPSLVSSIAAGVDEVCSSSADSFGCEERYKSRLKPPILSSASVRPRANSGTGTNLTPGFSPLIPVTNKTTRFAVMTTSCTLTHSSSPTVIMSTGPSTFHVSTAIARKPALSSSIGGVTFPASSTSTASSPPFGNGGATIIMSKSPPAILQQSRKIQPSVSNRARTHMSTLVENNSSIVSASTSACGMGGQVYLNVNGSTSFDMPRSSVTIPLSLPNNVINISSSSSAQLFPSSQIFSLGTSEVSGIHERVFNDAGVGKSIEGIPITISSTISSNQFSASSSLTGGSNVYFSNCGVDKGKTLVSSVQKPVEIFISRDYVTQPAPSTPSSLPSAPTATGVARGESSSSKPSSKIILFSSNRQVRNSSV